MSNPEMAERGFIVSVSVGFRTVDEAGRFLVGILTQYPHAEGNLAAVLRPVPVGSVADTSADGDAGAEALPPEASAPPAKAATLQEQVEYRKLFREFVAKHGIEQGQAMLSQFGARRWSDLGPEQMTALGFVLTGSK